MIVVSFQWKHRWLPNGSTWTVHCDRKLHFRETERTSQQPIILGCIVKENESIDNDFCYVCAKLSTFAPTSLRGEFEMQQHAQQKHKSPYQVYNIERRFIACRSTMTLLKYNKLLKKSNENLEWFLVLFIFSFTYPTPILSLSLFSFIFYNSFRPGHAIQLRRLFHLLWRDFLKMMATWKPNRSKRMHETNRK